MNIPDKQSSVDMEKMRATKQNTDNSEAMVKDCLARHGLDEKMLSMFIEGAKNDSYGRSAEELIEIWAGPEPWRFFAPDANYNPFTDPFPEHIQKIIDKREAESRAKIIKRIISRAEEPTNVLPDTDEQPMSIEEIAHALMHGTFFYDEQTKQWVEES